MSEDKTCPICNNGTLSSIRRKIPHSYKGVSGDVQMYSNLCNFCKIDLPTSTDLLRNQEEIERFKREAEAKLVNVSIYDVGNECYFGISFPHKSFLIPVNMDILDKIDMELFRYFRDKGKDNFEGRRG